MNYEQAEQLFIKKTMGKELPITTVLLETNMTLEKINKSFVINLHSTPIITILPNGLYRLSADGKLTNLTKSRMEKYSPVNLKQIDNWWWIIDKKEKILSLYYERVLIDKNGKPTIKISEKSIIFKRLVLILNEMISKISDLTVSNVLVKSFPKNETNNLIELLRSSSKDIKSIYHYSSRNYDVALNMDQLVCDMLRFGTIDKYYTYLNMRDNVFKSQSALLKAYFIPYITYQLKFILKQIAEKKRR